FRASAALGYTKPGSQCAPATTAKPPQWVCSWIGHCSLFPDTPHKGLKVLEKSLNVANVPVLARREPDGFYYLGTIKAEIEGERGTFLVEFDKPAALGEKYSVWVQKTVRDDILEYVNGMRHSILPGDKVLAPWEPDLVRYGPGTILLGIETRDPLRASEDEEIMVYFWNGKKVKVPRGVALWIPANTWERIIEMIHMPFTSRLKLMEPSHSTSSYIFTCRPLMAPIHSCALGGPGTYRWLCPLVHPSFHDHCLYCSPVHMGCLCCSCPKFSAWWPLPATSLLPQRGTELQESTNKPTAQFPQLESPKEKQSEAAAAASSTSSSDSESEEMSLPKTTMVDSAVNTDSSLFPESKLKDSARPEWKYWKRSHPKSHLGNPGIFYLLPW
uniref:Chromosome 11 open reading frame 16 n=1 Tax=Pelusios castaneus TaxID=367368 RepID=A0A8C8VR04_9SAUR